MRMFFHNMVSEQKIQIIPRKGEYCLLDKKVGEFVSHTIFQLPTKYGKGVLVTPTVHGNLMLETDGSGRIGQGKYRNHSRRSGGSAAACGLKYTKPAKTPDYHVICRSSCTYREE